MSRDSNARRSPFRRPPDRCAKGPGVPPFSRTSEGSARAPALFLRRAEPSWHQQPGVLLREAGRSSNFSSAPSNRRQGQEDPRRSPSQPFPPLRALRRPCHADGQGKDEAGTRVKVQGRNGATPLTCQRCELRPQPPRRVGGRLLRPGLLANLRRCASSPFGTAVGLAQSPERGASFASALPSASWSVKEKPGHRGEALSGLFCFEQNGERLE